MGRRVVFLPHWSWRGHCNSSQGAEVHGPAAQQMPFGRSVLTGAAAAEAMVQLLTAQHPVL